MTEQTAVTVCLSYAVAVQSMIVFLLLVWIRFLVKNRAGLINEQLSVSNQLLDARAKIVGYEYKLACVRKELDKSEIVRSNLSKCANEWERRYLEALNSRNDDQQEPTL